MLLVTFSVWVKRATFICCGFSTFSLSERTWNVSIVGDSEPTQQGRTIMPEVLRSATLTIQHVIDLPMGPPVLVIGRDTSGATVCQVTINATGVTISGPRGRVIRDLNWEQLVQLAERE